MNIDGMLFRFSGVQYVFKMSKPLIGLQFVSNKTLYKFFKITLKGYFVVWLCVPRTLAVAAAADEYIPSCLSGGRVCCDACHNNLLLGLHDDSPGHLTDKYLLVLHVMIGVLYHKYQSNSDIWVGLPSGKTEKSCNFDRFS